MFKYIYRKIYWKYKFNLVEDDTLYRNWSKYYKHEELETL